MSTADVLDVRARSTAALLSSSEGASGHPVRRIVLRGA
jgi:hypothetical protein